MNAPVKITGSIGAWTTSKWQDLDYVQSRIDQNKNDDAVNALSYSNSDMSDIEDWVKVGTAEITVTLFPREEVVAKELEGLNAQLQKVRADNMMRENAILDRISKLQALEYKA